LFDQIVTCLKLLQNGKDKNVAVVYRALLILAYGIFSLPLEDLEMAANANNIELRTDVKDVFIDVIMQNKD
jgi:hypothetical protein